MVKYGSFILFCRSSAEGIRTIRNAGEGNQTRDIQQPRSSAEGPRTIKNAGPRNQARDLQQLTFEDEEIMEYVFSMINSFISSFDHHMMNLY